jgi:hypothetical protein
MSGRVGHGKGVRSAPQKHRDPFMAPYEPWEKHQGRICTNPYLAIGGRCFSIWTLQLFAPTTRVFAQHDTFEHSGLQSTSIHGRVSSTAALTFKSLLRTRLHNHGPSIQCSFCRSAVRIIFVTVGRSKGKVDIDWKSRRPDESPFTRGQDPAQTC